MKEFDADILNNEVISNILSRRSIRKYKSTQIKEKELKTILTCGLYAPNGSNLQSCRLVVLQNPDIMERLNEVIRTELASKEIVEGQIMNRGILRARQTNYHFIYHAPTLISAVAPKDYSNSMADCAAALENIQLAAASIGLGTCWSNQAHWLTDSPAVRKIFEKIGMREDEDIFGSVSVGYPDYIAKGAVPRREGRITRDCSQEIFTEKREEYV